MRSVAAILLIFFIRCVYLLPLDLPFINEIGNVFNDSCIFGPKSMSMILYNSANFEGKNIGAQESCDNVDPSKPIVFLVHGFISYANTTSSYNLASQFVKKGYTVFSLDWSKAACKDGIPIARLAEYPQAVINTRKIGELMAKYVLSLMEDCEFPLYNITFIGHSLGAHVCAFAAKHIKDQKKGYKIPRIIGLDPAAPLFELNTCKEKLCESDATYVIIFHTSILGISKSIGDMDFHFGGPDQPGCGVNFACSHSKAIDYCTDTLISNCAYPGVPTNKSFLSISALFGRGPSYPDADTTDCIRITDEIFTIKPGDKLRKGTYSVFVNPKSPYCTQKSLSCPFIIDKSDN